MKIAFVGNMNNNNFAMMRYFRDLGADAYLLPCRNDGIGTLAHFSPEADSWELEKWRAYIFPLSFDNSSTSVVGNIFKLARATPKQKIIDELSGYDIYIGSGATPAIFDRVGKKLNVFYPYATGIEFVDTHEYLDEYRRYPIKRPFLRLMRKKQIKGIIDSKVRINSELGVTKTVFEKLGCDTKVIQTPQVYNNDKGIKDISNDLLAVVDRIDKSDFSVLSHSRHIWKQMGSLSNEEWFNITKNNHWLIRGFAKFLARNSALKAILVLFDYGPDVIETKKEIKRLGIDTCVLWVPVSQRREILCLLEHVDVGVGEFNVSPGTIWGGTAWESLAMGKPTLQSMNFQSKDFQKNFRAPLPPLLDVRAESDVANHLNRLANDPVFRNRIGEDSRRWFDVNNGVGASGMWLEEVVKSHSKR